MGIVSCLIALKLHRQKELREQQDADSGTSHDHSGSAQTISRARVLAPLSCNGERLHSVNRQEP
jgi:hypothetical protein